MAINPNPFRPNTRATQRRRTLDELKNLIRAMSNKEGLADKFNVSIEFAKRYGFRIEKVQEDYFRTLEKFGEIEFPDLVHVKLAEPKKHN